MLSLSLMQAVELDRKSLAFAEAETGTEKKISVDPTGDYEGYSGVLYDNTNGLPTSEAKAITETQEGFIWIGSYSGLIRYDGNTFERIDSRTGIASVVSLFTDSKNRLWVGTNDAGVAVMINDEFKMYNKEDGLRSLSVRSITEDKNGNIYLATTHGMAYFDSDLELHSIDEPQINEEYIRYICMGPNNTLYGLTVNSAVFTMKDGKITGFHDLKRLGIEDVHSILPDQEHPGNVYIPNRQSEIFYGSLDQEFNITKTIEVSPLDYINSVTLFDEMLWVCTDNGIGFVRNGELVIVDNVPMTNTVECAMLDYQGNLWFVSTKQGVMKIVPNQFYDVSESCKLPETVVNSTCLFDNKLFIGSQNEGLQVVYNSEFLTSLPISYTRTAKGGELPYTDLLKFFDKAKIRSLIRDSKNRMWISTFGECGLVRYDGEGIVQFTTDDGLPSERIRTVYERADGSLLVACTGGVAIIKDDKITEVFGEAAGISNTEVLTVTDADNGDIILGTDGDGIYVLNGSNAVHYGTDSGLSSDIVMRVKKDADHNVYWIVTSNSIAYMTYDYEIHTIKDFPYSNNFDLYENKNGEMWILSSNGIYIVPADELIKNEEISAIFYGSDNGLPCISTSNSYSELTENGDLYISGTTGVAKVNIDKPFESVDNLKIAVPYIEADGEKIFPDEDGEFTVSSDTQKITIYSYVYNYSLVNPEVSYQLEGFDNSATSLKRSELAPIDYTNLNGGDYYFVMEISDPFGNSSNSIKVHIVKEKAFYEKLWFQILGLLLIFLFIVLIVFLIIHIRTKKFLKKEKENKLLIREIVEAFAKTIDMKDKYTNGHSSRVAEYTAMLTKELGYDEEIIEKYYNIALMHDIGKIGIPGEVLNKPGKLTDLEFAKIKSHSALGYNVLKDISIMPELAIGAGSHHERPDGRGYPKGLKGSEIPRVAQIIAVADTFDAMYSDRPYRKRMNFDKVVSIMKEVRGTQLTEDVVDAFLRLVEKGEFRDPNDDGGGTTEDIDNIHKKFNKQAETAAEKKEDKEVKEDKTDK